MLKKQNIPKKPSLTTENAESRAVVSSAFEMASVLGISTLVVQADELRDARLISKIREDEKVIWLTRNKKKLVRTENEDDVVVGLPETTLTRMSQLKVGLLFSVMNGYVELDETVLCLSGIAGSDRLDMLLITNARRDYPWFRKHGISDARGQFSSGEVARILDIALRLAAEGREAKPIGTMIVLGDESELSPYCRQLILNPFKGHLQKERNIHNPMFFETIREFSGLDGGIIVNRNGVVLSAGTYVDAGVKKIKLKPGLGARHAAAQSITSITNSVAFAISSSSGTVTVFHEGEVILELERPERTSRL